LQAEGKKNVLMSTGFGLCFCVCNDKNIWWINLATAASDLAQ
jgi:hypothetical protein